MVHDHESPKNAKKRRSSGSDTLQCLREKAENDRELKRQELELQRQEMTMRHTQFQQTQQQSQQMMVTILHLLQNKQRTLAYGLFPYFLLIFLVW